ncbi:hypothetical protein QMK19_27710 [Streptomyces sp. H10-C2]|uniref:hypothetical protein n=1 Tax=unclassified Streptomyces TaxID=2593676 RepID=UPI0024B9939C|nr:MULTISPECIES: hypothetical protein [unclassified Streptomyces]MDJ0343898.1 hypothetical protein [Streptomyces sp. PH10-H1]MDJ0373339.1 hypothetical protein [Streptomyces sp. H10-C2]
MRALLGVLGVVVVLGIYSSVLRTLVIPRASRSGFTQIVQRLVHRPFQLVADQFGSAETKDRVLAPAAPVAIVVTLMSWLVCFMGGYALLEAAVSGLGPQASLFEAGSSLFTLGFASSNRATLTAIDFCAAATGPVVIGLQIGYLPTLYGAYARRETEVTMLQARAGSPPWGPEILVRYAQVELLDSLTDLFRNWERWAAEVSESHTTYPVLIAFRSPRATRNWLVALLSVMDAAALRLALNPSGPQAEVRMALRAGFVCLRDIADVRGIPYDRDPHPDDPLQLDYAEYLRGVARMADKGYPMERTPEEAWPHFRGWRVNYETLAYRLARDIDAVPAPWSGTRRTTVAISNPVTPVDRRPVG